MLEELREDTERYRQNERYILITAIKAVYSHPGYLGVIWYRFGHFFWINRKNPIWGILLVLNRLFYPLVRMYSGLQLSPKTEIGPGFYVGHFGPTLIHPDVKAGRHLTIVANAIIGEARRRVPLIGDNVSIGAGAIIIGGITIDDDVTIGAGSIVTHDVSKGKTVISARIINVKELS